MAQLIKKLQNGGNPRKYGTFTIDNTTYDVDDEFINQLSHYGASLDERTGNQFKNIIDAVKRGENLTFDSTGGGTLTGNVNWDVTDRQKRRLEKSRTRAGSLFGNL